MIRFTTKILQFGEMGEKTGWTYIRIPAAVAEQVNAGKQKIFSGQRRLDGHCHRESGIDADGGGRFHHGAKASIRKSIRKQKGDSLRVELEVDKAVIKPPKDLMECLADEPEALAYFRTLPKSHQNYFGNWVREAKTEGTRTKRLASVVMAMMRRQNFGEMLRARNGGSGGFFQNNLILLTFGVYLCRPKSMDRSHLSKVTSAGLLITLGIIFGDIGTSPLYTFQTIMTEGGKVSQELVFGAISCVFWTLTLQTTFKYVFITLKADNRGEGGVFSLYALVRRYGKVLVYPAIIGAGTLLADGIITPPISVTSAIEGLGAVHGMENVIVPGNALVVEIVMVILLLLFIFQRFGTKMVGGSFGPIMFVWFTMLGILGLNQILHYPGVLKALSPHYGLELLIMHPKGFWLLGAVFLCTTGAEALVFRPGALRAAKYPGQLDLCQDDAGTELSGSGRLGAAAA